MKFKLVESINNQNLDENYDINGIKFGTLMESMNNKDYQGVFDAVKNPPVNIPLDMWNALYESLVNVNEDTFYQTDEEYETKKNLEYRFLETFHCE